MNQNSFQTRTGRSVSAVTAEEMLAVDRVAVEDVGLALLQMMENAGRALARQVHDIRDEERVVVVAGNGGNGGGGLACARHLANRDVPVQVVLDRVPRELTGAAAHQHRILEAMSVPVIDAADGLSRLDGPHVAVDALIGYGLSGEVRSPASRYVETMNNRFESVVSLDVPSGIDATTGEILGDAVRPDRTVTLALPKTGLASIDGRLLLADIGIPKTVYHRLDIEYANPFGEHDWVELVR
ncbi:ADP-dependent NAD(P)H-hydrate dehydratase [Halalkaliarchaeum desulfuricum]|uniref:NAD(P)H-hydrate epimerase n=1 Tax=Halalkaliarchaeum desulfuricum TaxID=2055893 RepID=A0A343TKE7_9EURY|nr:NAD(P)H-hydrate epimerase [Halalkaliarchaeum desulfuricum]AUX09569.1 ADP-dependent NAD(P)H-hydrate dehydratase [Halalkaliarchaeum desulfuricum]